MMHFGGHPRLPLRRHGAMRRVIGLLLLPLLCLGSVLGVVRVVTVTARRSRGLRLVWRGKPEAVRHVVGLKPLCCADLRIASLRRRSVETLRAASLLLLWRRRERRRSQPRGIWCHAKATDRTWLLKVPASTRWPGHLRMGTYGLKSMG